MGADGRGTRWTHRHMRPSRLHRAVTIVELDAAPDLIEQYLTKGATWRAGRPAAERRLVQRAIENLTDPLGQRCYRPMGYEPICIPRVTMALDAGYRNPIEAEDAGMALPPMCGQCPAERFDAAMEFEVLYGGAAGGSKTKSAVMMTLRCLWRWPGMRALFLRETFDQLDENVYPELRAVDYGAAIGGKWVAGRREVQFHGGQSVCRFRYMADMDDVLQRRGGSYQLIVVDERNLLPAGITDGLRDRLRSANPNVPVIGFRLTANPGGKGHGELKRQFVAATSYGARTADVTIGQAHFQRRYIPAKSTDNPYLGPDYEAQVLGAIEDPVLRAAQRDGNWDIFVGQYFGEWNHERHVVPRSAVSLAASWPRSAGIDYGYAAPWCCLWGAVDNDKRLWLYREEYATKVGETEQAKRIDRHETEADEDVRHYADPSMMAKRGEVKSIAEAYRLAADVRLLEANNDRIAGWARVRSFLAEAPACAYHRELGWDTCPRLHVIDGTCPNLVRTLPDLPYSTTKIEDLDTDAEDHAADALRYLVMGVRDRRPTKLVGALLQETRANV